MATATLPADVGPLSKALNGLVAGAISLWLATKSAHWHVSGPMFPEYHDLFDAQAEQIYGAIDPLAERVRKLGLATISGLTSVYHNCHAIDIAPNLAAGAMIRNLLAENRQMERALGECLTLALDAKDGATENLLQSLLDETQRRIWFLEMTSRGEEKYR